ncbi:hypothetical protein MVEN_00190200 [Mycena venus]|uniref:Uncharacterized protein n=1 Tax=Mycena venus TaxID=2733690 RepID=A0A8H6Z3K2_9AGAR|nr:hypothetical protein MVEN_00190200 [Mycena venus]
MNSEISYKLYQQLKVYFNGPWKTNMNIKQTKAMMLNVPETLMRPHYVASGLLALNDKFDPGKLQLHTGQTPAHPSASTPPPCFNRSDEQH